jgi:threonine synthase
LELFQILISSYAEDGGLYVPTELPLISQSMFCRWKSESFPLPQICAAIIGLFTDDIEDNLLVEMANAAFESFNGGGNVIIPFEFMFVTLNVKEMNNSCQSRNWTI